MEIGTVAQWITAATGLVTAIGGLMVVLKTLIPTHRLVNQQRTDMLRFQTVLIRTLIANGIDVPEDQSTLD